MMQGLFEKQMSSLMDLMKLLYCLCRLLLYYEDTENSWCARKVSYPSPEAMRALQHGKENLVWPLPPPQIISGNC